MIPNNLMYIWTQLCEKDIEKHLYDVYDSDIPP
jgi:hypothetical protein